MFVNVSAVGLLPRAATREQLLVRVSGLESAAKTTVGISSTPDIRYLVKRENSGAEQ